MFKFGMAFARRISSPLARAREQGLGRAAAAAAVHSGEHPRRPLSAARAGRRAAAVDPGKIRGRRKSDDSLEVTVAPAQRGVLTRALCNPALELHP